MKLKEAIVFLCIAFQMICCAQSDTSKKTYFMKLYAASLNGGVYEFTDYELSREELQTANPDNNLLKKDISKYNYEGNNRQYEGFCLNANTSFIFLNKLKRTYSKKQELRFGISYQTNEQFKYDYLLNERMPFDTLKSNTNPKQFYIDTTKTSTYSYSNYRTNFLIDVTHTFHTKQNKIYSAYIGYSLGYGRIISNITTVEYNYSEGFEDQNYNTYDYTSGNTSNISDSELSKTNGGNSFQAAIAIGGLIRYSRTKKNYMKRFALNCETKTGMRLTQIPGYNDITQYFFNINFGIKYYLNRENIK